MERRGNLHPFEEHGREQVGRFGGGEGRSVALLACAYLLLERDEVDSDQGGRRPRRNRERRELVGGHSGLQHLRQHLGGRFLEFSHPNPEQILTTLREQEVGSREVVKPVAKRSSLPTTSGGKRAVCLLSRHVAKIDPDQPAERRSTERGRFCMVLKTRILKTSTYHVLDAFSSSVTTA